MIGCLKRQGRDTTLRTLKIESLLNLKRPRTRGDVAHFALEYEYRFSPRGGCGEPLGAVCGAGGEPPTRAARLKCVEGARIDCQETTGRGSPAVSRGDSSESTD